jgi:hypothetical protein
MTQIHGLKEVCVQVELQSAVRKNRFSVPQRGFFHTPVYTAISSMNNVSVNHRATAADSPFVTNTTPPPPPPPQTMLSSLQKQAKKE